MHNRRVSTSRPLPHRPTNLRITCRILDRLTARQALVMAMRRTTAGVVAVPAMAQRGTMATVLQTFCAT